MRVVGGSAKGRALAVVPGKGTRPVMDRVKTALFDVLRPIIDGVRVLDLFAGSGSVGIEALSQGAAHCTFVDLGREAIATVRKNLQVTGFTNQATVIQTRALDFLASGAGPFDLIYIAPPQYKDIWVETMRALDARPELLRLADEAGDDGAITGQIIVQIDPREYQALPLMNLQEVRQKRYGNTLLVFYEPGEPIS